MPNKDLLPDSEIEKKLKDLPEWKRDGKMIVRVQTFPQYKDAMNFVYAVGELAEKENHHPDIVMNFKRVEVRYWTHTARGLSELDFHLAKGVEALIPRFYQKKAN